MTFRLSGGGAMHQSLAVSDAEEFHAMIRYRGAQAGLRGRLAQYSARGIMSQVLVTQDLQLADADPCARVVVGAIDT